MRVRLALFATLTGYLPSSADPETDTRHERSIDLPDGTTVGQVVDSLSLPDEPRVIFVDGRHQPESYVLAEGERLAIFPPVAGG